MATKSSKIAVTLQPDLKQKLREYGKDNQIKNFSGVILSILDEYFGEGAPTSPPSDVWETIQSLTTRLDALEEGTATTAAPEKPQRATPVKAAPTKRKSARSSTTAKPTAKKPTAKSSPKRSPSKAASKTSRTTKSTSTRTAKPTKAKPTRATKSSSKAAPVKKDKTTTRRTTAAKKPTRSKTTADWMSTREAFNIYGGNLSWSRFSKLTPEELKERFNLDSDLSRKVRGSRFNQWLKPGK